MIRYLIKFYDEKNEILYEVWGEKQINTFHINDDFFKEIFSLQNINNEKISFCDIYVDCENSNVIIDNYTIYQTVSLFNFNDTKSSISLLKAKDTNLHIVGFEINHVETNNSLIFFADCRIKTFNCNIENYISLIKDKSSTIDNHINRFELRRTEVDVLAIHCSIDCFIVSESKIDKFETFTVKDFSQEIKEIYINQTSFSRLALNCTVNTFSLVDSDISRLLFATKSNIEKLIVEKSNIINVYNCSIDTVKEESIEVWRLIRASAKQEKNDTLYANASYKVAELESTNKNKLANWFLRESIGYGYKPANSIKFVIFTILLFAVVYSGIDFIAHIVGNKSSIIINKDFIFKCVKGFMKNFYFSGITFTTVGYGDITPTSIIARILAVFEACIGVSVLSLFIFSLTKRYID